jgi:hypothetical protein
MPSADDLLPASPPPEVVVMSHHDYEQQKSSLNMMLDASVKEGKVKLAWGAPPALGAEEDDVVTFRLNEDILPSWAKKQQVGHSLRFSVFK